MATDTINGSLQKRYPKVKFTSAYVLDNRAVALYGKAETIMHEPGEKYYVLPLLKKGKRTDIYPNLPTPFIDVIRVVKSLDQIPDKSAVVVNATDLSEPLVGRIDEYISWPSAVNEMYRQYLKEENVDKLVAQTADIMRDHVDTVEQWVDRDYAYYFVDDLLISKHAHVKQLREAVLTTTSKKADDDVFPAGVFMSVHNNLVLRVTSGQTTLTYRGFIYLNARGFPMIELLMVKNEDANKIRVDKNDKPTAVTLAKLYTEFFKSDYFNMVAQYVHHEKSSPIMVVNEMVVEQPEIIAEYNGWGMGYEYLDSLSGIDKPSANVGLQWAKDNPDGTIAPEQQQFQIIEQLVDTESGEVVSEHTLTADEIQERADEQARLLNEPATEIDNASE